MSISVHTNKPALVALQNLNATNDQIGEVQNHINTGLKIATAQDNAAGALSLVIDQLSALAGNASRSCVREVIPSLGKMW